MVSNFRTRKNAVRTQSLFWVIRDRESNSSTSIQLILFELGVSYRSSHNIVHLKARAELSWADTHLTTKEVNGYGFDVSGFSWIFSDVPADGCQSPPSLPKTAWGDWVMKSFDLRFWKKDFAEGCAFAPSPLIWKDQCCVVDKSTFTAQ